MQSVHWWGCTACSETVKNLLGITVLGAAYWGGIGAIVLSVVSLVGKLGDTGSCYWGHWSVSVAVLGGFYGAVGGILVSWLLAIVWFRLPFKELEKRFRFCGAVALVSGCFASAYGPLYAALASGGGTMMGATMIACLGLFRHHQYSVKPSDDVKPSDSS